MKKLLGEKLIKENLISEEQLKKGLERQRLHGGRIGYNLAVLGFIDQEDLNKHFRNHPPAPETIEDTGLNRSFLEDLVMRHALSVGNFRLAELVDRIKLHRKIVDEIVEHLRKDHLLEVQGATEYNKSAWVFTLTDKGRSRAAELFQVSRYVGPAPVPLNQYNHLVETQTIEGIRVNEDTVNQAFSQMVVTECFLNRIGPAVNSGRAIFLYGPPGNGKTAIAETVGQVLPDTVYIPHAVYVGGEIVSVFDPVTHVKAEPKKSVDQVDQRWLLCHRPIVMVGGEFTLKMLDLDFNPIAKFYEGALQMKANNGLFIVDDFGRQQIDPQNMLNRWIVPLERRTDFLSLHTGMKFEIPFDQLVIFATNIEPKQLVSEAFLRRIRYKIKIGHPTRNEYEKIFRRVCEANGLEFSLKVFTFLVEDLYNRHGVQFSACHPRDLIDQILDDAHYHNKPPELTCEALSRAWDSYFVEM
ncbi:MAG: ATPase [Desulfuromonadales bacterium]